MTTPAWMAAPITRPCTEAPDRWFSKVRKDQLTAIALCERCPLLAKCREYALEQHPQHGIWGGLTAKARRSGPAPLVQRRTSVVPVDCSNATSYAQHRRRGETCKPCQAKRAAQIKAERRARLAAEHAEHGGSMIGYHTHKALGEEPCDACREVNRARCAAIRASRRRSHPNAA